MLAGIAVLLGVQLTLAFIGCDIAGMPTRPIHPLRRDAAGTAGGESPNRAEPPNQGTAG